LSFLATPSHNRPHTKKQINP